MNRSGAASIGYSSPLRESQVALTRARILDAVAALIERGSEPTYAAIAERAQVQERTVYRHFPSREELHAEFWGFIQERYFAVPDETRDLESLCAQVSRSFEGFARREALARGLLHSLEGRAIRASASAHDERRRRYERVVRAEAPGLGREATRRAAAALQVLSSAMSWEYLRDYWDMNAETAAATVHEAAAAMVRGLRRKGSPASKRRPKERKRA